MRGHLYTTFCLSLLSASPAALLADAAPPSPAAAKSADAPPAVEPSDEIARLIDDLSDVNFNTRERATERLLEIAGAARPALQEATHSDNPELAGRARSLLRRLPWQKQEDPAPVKVALRNYSTNTPDGDWINAVNNLRSTAGGSDALLRLLRYEIDPQRRWHIAGVLRSMPREPAVVAELQALDSEIDNPPALWVAASAWLSRDFRKSMQLLARGVQVELEQPVPLQAGAGPVSMFGELQKIYERTGRAAEAAALLRRWHAVRPSREISDALFALHANRPGLPLLAEDLVQYDRPVSSPMTWYTNAKFVARVGFGAAAESLRIVADAISSAQPVEGQTPDARRVARQGRRYELGTFLLERGWPEAAERELRAVLALADKTRDTYAVNVHFRLASIAAARKDDATAAAEYRKALEQWEGTGGILTAEIDGEQVAGDDAAVVMRSIMHRYGLKAAVAAGDAEDVVRQAEALVDLGTKGRHGGVRGTDPDLAIDAVLALREAGQDELAAKLFSQAYSAGKAVLDANPGEPRHMNTLAWLCARCGERLDEAETLMQKAIALAPDNPAFIDTAAEVQFQKGNFDKAVELSKQAIKLAPDAPELKEQMARFQAGRQAPATRPAKPLSNGDQD